MIEINKLQTNNIKSCIGLINSEIDDNIARERVFLKLRALDDLKKELTSMITSGKDNILARNG